MKAPKGYRWLRVGEVIKKGDQFATWYPVNWAIGYKNTYTTTYIRRIKRKVKR